MSSAIKNCNRCKGAFVFTDVEIVCGSCGVVSDEKIVDCSADYENIGMEINSGRTGPPANPMYHNGIASEISQTGRDASGRNLRGENKSMMNRLITWDKRGKSSGTKTRNISNLEITRIAEVLSISEQTKQRGAEIFRMCEGFKMLRGRSAKVFSAACLYAACRESGLSKTLTDFSKVGFFRRQDLAAYYRLIVRVCDIKTKVVSPISYVSRIASNVDPPLSVSIQKNAIKLLEKLNDSKAGKDPIAFAAAALYHVCQSKNLRHTQRVMGMAAGVTEVTIRNRINDIRKELCIGENLKVKNNLDEKPIGA